MLKLKSGVSLAGIKPEIVALLPTIVEIVQKYDSTGDCIITSACDGKHGFGSLHYVGYAIDVRSKNMPIGYRKKCIDELSEISDEVDAVLEKSHFHLEFQPKRNR